MKDLFTSFMRRCSLIHFRIIKYRCLNCFDSNNRAKLMTHYCFICFVWVAQNMQMQLHFSVNSFFVCEYVSSKKKKLPKAAVALVKPINGALEIHIYFFRGVCS